MWISKNIILVAILYILPICFRAVKAVECDSDEVCKPIEAGSIEYRHFLNRNYAALKICGIESRTTKHCCKIVQSRFDESISPSGDGEIAQSRYDESISPLADGDLNNHPNLHLINHKKCGKMGPADRMVGGEEAAVGQFPWMVLLMYRSKTGEDGAFFLCGGSLISTKHVLTAAHCLNPGIYTLFAVRLGEHRISTSVDCTDPNDSTTCSQDNPQIQDIEIEKMIPHPEFGKSGAKDDIALLTLKSEPILKGIKNIKTICLPVSSEQSIEKIIESEGKNPMMLVSGWGLTESGIASDVLRFAYIPLTSPEQCIAAYRVKIRRTVNINDRQLCAGGLNKTDSCKGDSGSPLSYASKSSRMIQHGIVSYGSSTCSTVVPLPGVYTRVSSYMKWILDNLSN